MVQTVKLLNSVANIFLIFTVHWVKLEGIYQIIIIILLHSEEIMQQYFSFHKIIFERTQQVHKNTGLIVPEY